MYQKITRKRYCKNDIGQFIIAVDDLISSGELSPTAAECHNILHAIGQDGGIYSQNINETISHCSSLCTYGCFHGVVEGFTMGGGDLFKEISSLCLVDNNRLFEAACYHGLGHGFAFVAGYDVKKALSFCDLLPVRGQRINCGFGVFMELYGAGSFAHTSLEWPENIPEFCRTLTDPYSFICHISAGSHEYNRSLDVAKSFETCQLVPKETFSKCNIAIGRILYHNIKNSESKIVEACQNNQNNDEDVFFGLYSRSNRC